jgi:hypothetical protein
MANQEVTFQLGGKSYAVRFTQNAIYRIERELGRSMMRIDWRDVPVQMMLWAGLEGARLKHRGEPGVRLIPFTIEEVGDLIDAMRGEEPPLFPFDLAMEAFRLAFPAAAKPGEAGEAAPDPPKEPAKHHRAKS